MLKKLYEYYEIDLGPSLSENLKLRSKNLK